jgi:hypothetical protein
LARPKKLRIGSKVYDLPHPFEEEAESLIRTNQKLLCERISELEHKSIADLSANSGDADIGAQLAWVQSEADRLRRQAISMSLVSLVTRLQHWMREFVWQLNRKKPDDASLKKSLTVLKNCFGKGPVPTSFFTDLESVRDSIIHVDSEVDWTYRGNQRSVPVQYRDVTHRYLELTQAHLDEAIEKSKAQIYWYESQLDALGLATKSQDERTA